MLAILLVGHGWDKHGAHIYGYPIPKAGIGRHGSAVEKLKGVVDTINRGMLLDPSYHVLGNGVDKEMSHIMFSQNCVGIWKKDNAKWNAAGVQA